MIEAAGRPHFFGPCIVTDTLATDRFVSIATIATVEPARIIARLQGVPGADMARFEQVVAEHAQRMARGESYAWHWQREPA